MKRRGFLGLLGGAAVAGPGMASKAAASLVDANLSGVAMATASGMSLPAQRGYGAIAGELGVDDGLAADLARLVRRSPEEHTARQRKQYINGLDPDLVANRSMALHRKIAIQKRREYWRGLDEDKSWLQRRIDGIFDW